MTRQRKQYSDKKLDKLISVIAKNLTIHRETAGLSQNKLSEKSGVALSTINEIENLKVKDMRLSTISTLAKTLKIDPIDLMKNNDLKVSKTHRDRFMKACNELELIRRSIE